jgi:hypothetical protein
MAQATFRFHGELSDFLQHKRRNLKPEIVKTFQHRASVKDMIESLGVPHAEIEALLVDGAAVGFEKIVEDGAKVDVYPRAEMLNGRPGLMLRPPIPAPPRFVLDIHLGRLAAYLRMLGFDSAWRNDFPDDELAQVAHDEARILLTRDVGCLKRSPVIWGYFVRGTDPAAQIREVMGRFDLAPGVQLFRRCMKCNALVEPVEKDAIRDALPQGTALYFDEFHRCRDCGRIFWKGSHYERMRSLIDELMGK